MPEDTESNKNELVAELHEIMGEKEGKRPVKNRKLVFALIIILVIAIPFAAVFLADKYAAKKFAALAASINSPCKITYDKTEYSLITGHLKVSNLVVSCEDEEAAKFAIVDFFNIKSGSIIPERLSAEITGGFINPKHKIFGSLGNFTSELEYNEILFNGEFSYILDGKNKFFQLKKFLIDTAHIGQIEAELSINNIYTTDTQSILKQIVNNDYTDIQISFTNRGLAQRIIELYGRANDLDPIAAQSRALRGIERRIAHKYKNDVNVRDKAVQVYRFIQNPTKILLKTDSQHRASVMKIVKFTDFKGWRNMLYSLEEFPLILYMN